LKQYFSGIVNKKRLLGALKSMLHTILVSEEYMLETSSFVWDPQYIFVNPNTARVSLIALPLQREGGIAVEDFIRQLIFGIQFDQTEDCSYIAALISYLNSNQFFSAKELEKLVENLQQETSPKSVPQTPAPQVNAPQAAKTIPKPTAAAPMPVPASTPAAAPVAAPAEREKVPVKIEKKPVASAPAALPKEKPRKKGLFGKKKEKPVKEKKGKDNPFGNFAIPGQNPGAAQKGKPVQGGAAVQAKQPPHQPSVPAQQVGLQTYAARQQDFGGTVVLRPESEGTTVLTPPSGGVKNAPYLFCVRTQQKFVLGKENSKIGKDPAHVDFCIQGNSAVSREHAVLYWKNGDVFISDNQSTNGTYLNGEPIGAGMVTGPLKHGTKVRLGNEELEFREHE